MTQTDNVTELEIIESLDFNLEQPCEHSQHGRNSHHSGPAYYYIRSQSPCGHTNACLYICKSGFESPQLIRCSTCDLYFLKENFWTVLGTVK